MFLNWQTTPTDEAPARAIANWMSSLPMASSSSMNVPHNANSEEKLPSALVRTSFSF